MRAELLCRWRELAARMPFAESWIEHIAAVAVRKSEVEPRARRVVELIGRHIVAHVVRAVVGEPELLGARVPVEADAVADPARENLALAARGVAADGSVFVFGLAHVARRADADVEQAIGTEANRLVAVMRVVR